MQFVAGNGSITNQIPLATELSAYQPELTWAQNMLEVIDFHQGILHRNVVFRSCEYFQCIWNFILKCMYYEILMSAQAFLFLTSDSAAFRKAKLTCRHFSSSTSKYLIHHHPKAHIVAKCLPTHQTHQRIIKYIQVYTSVFNTLRYWNFAMEQCQKVDAVGHVAVVHEVPPTWCCKHRQANLVGISWRNLKFLAAERSVFDYLMYDDLLGNVRCFFLIFAYIVFVCSFSVIDPNA